MAVPTWVVGQVLTAADVDSWFVPVPAYKTAVTTRNTLTKSIDPDLQITLAASAVYQIQAGIIYASANAMDFTWVIPASATGGYSAGFNQAGIGDGFFSFVWTATPSAAALRTAVLVHGMIQTAGSGGTFGLSWASSTGPASLTLGVGSVLTANRVG
jgi:hypothetical protein